MMNKHQQIKDQLKGYNRQQLENIIDRLLKDTLFAYMVEVYGIKEGTIKTDEMQAKNPEAYSYSKNRLREVG